MTASATAGPTAFVLVPEIHTRAWVWDELASHLEESGALVHAVELSAEPGTDLETHIGEVRSALASVGDGAARVILVGHGYGIHPALGAADRDPGRVARVVHLDAGSPQDGDPPLALVADQALREHLPNGLAPGGGLGPGGEFGPDRGLAPGGGMVPPPDAGATQRWGSLAGVPAAQAELLMARAVAQPSATLTQPLRLTGAAARLPSTGVLCTANGTSIALVELLSRMGDPRIRALAGRDVRFHELPTGHWPMLSCPAELATLLFRAAAGGGRRLAPPPEAALEAGAEAPAAFLLDVPVCPRERVGRVDLHLPTADASDDDADGTGTGTGTRAQATAAGPRPAVVFVHGGPVPADRRPTPRDSPLFLGYARYAASLGAVGVTLDHRLHDLSAFDRAAEDVAAAVDLVRADPRVDADRIALWFLSAGGVLAADWLAAPPPWLRCVALSYPVLAPLPNWGLDGPRHRPARAVRSAGRLPVVLTRAGRELPEIAATVDAFLDAARDCAAQVELIDVPHAQHGFETLTPTDGTRTAVRQATASVLRHLRAR